MSSGNETGPSVCAFDEPLVGRANEVFSPLETGASKKSWSGTFFDTHIMPLKHTRTDNQADYERWI